MVKICDTCKYESTPMYEEPCKTGITHPDYDCWEAKDDDKQR